MAKQFVKISLATKLRLLFSVAVLGIIAAALGVPWYFMEQLAEQGVQSPAAEVTRMRLNEWLRKHPSDLKHTNETAILYTANKHLEGRSGPRFVKLSTEMTAEPPLDTSGRQALKAFLAGPGKKLAVLASEDERGRKVYRCFRAVRVEASCQSCHGPSAIPAMQYQPGQLVGMIDITVPGVEISGPLIWLIRGAFVLGGTLAVLLAIVLFAIISQRLILRPMRHLRDMADKVAEGDLTVRSEVRTGDELERLGESFNEMLSAISEQHTKLRQANRALDLKLSELGEANVMLFQANKVKTEFLANVSHELRTPLNSMIGFADLLVDSTDERIGRYGRNIRSAAKQLLNMINDLLDLAKIEAGKAEVRWERVSVSDVCQTLTALMAPLAEKKQITLTAEIDEDLPIVETDPGKLQQILFNLLSNAVKFTPVGGSVTVSAWQETHQRNGRPVGEVAVAIADTGPGIAEADQQQVFEKFYQADRTLTREAGGTGLGLAIAKELTQLLSARLTLKSSPGGGTTFTFVLPVRRPQPQPDA